jgi:hypothetical protein
MQAIRTQYKGPTDTKGSRIIAASYKRISVMPYDHELDLDANHERAAILHAIKAWPQNLVRLRSGTLRDGSYVHVIIETKETC